MATHLRRRWEARFEGMSRRDRPGCSYDAYLPDRLAGWNPTVSADVAADVADAEMAVRRLNDSGTAHVSLEGLAQFLLRTESVGSSRIEGLEAAARRLARAEAAIALGGDANDRVAIEVLGNVAAMQVAVEAAVDGTDFTVDDLLNIHVRSMTASPTPGIAGVVRESQNWIGGSVFNPCSASYVPPPPEHVPGLVDDLISYVNRDDPLPSRSGCVRPPCCCVGCLGPRSSRCSRRRG
jgi:Fic family protein